MRTFLNFQRGFLPVEDPLLRLPLVDDAVFNFNSWLNFVAEDLPAQLQQKSLRNIIDALNKEFLASAVPLININYADAREVDNATVILTMLIQAYVYEDTAQPARIIPRVLAENLLELLKHNSRVPVLTYSDYVLQNWRRVDKNLPITLDNIEPIFTFTGSTEEDWFIKVHVMVEAVFAQAIEAAANIHALAKTAETKDAALCIADNFIAMAQSIEQAAAVITKMFDHCSPEFFFNVLRPLLEGTDKAGGIIFDLSSDKGAQYPVKYRGSSGAQSSTLPALDAILGVKHPNDKLNLSLQAFMDYMPSLHKAFIIALKNTRVPDSPERREAINQLWLFRKVHLQMPAQYIVKEAVKKGIPPEEVTGTGSTNIDLFLVKRARKTSDAALEQL